MNTQQTGLNALRTAASVSANATVVLSANYIVFYILDHYNPGLHFVLHATFFLTAYLHLLIAGLMPLTGLLYLWLFRVGAFDAVEPSRTRAMRIVVLDVLLAGTFALLVNAHAFDWLHLRELKPADITAVATLPSTPQAVPPSPTAPAQTSSAAPSVTAQPTATPIPGLLGNRFAEKFREGDPIAAAPNTVETLADGTVRTLLYTYAGRQAAVEVYHCQNGKLQYQIAEVYVRDIRCLAADYVLNRNDAKRLPAYAQALSAIVAINTDNFLDNAANEGLIVRNGYLLQSKPCRSADLCVLYQDGTVRCFSHDAPIDNDAILASYPYHTFYFGPSLLNNDGSEKTAIRSSVATFNPRSAFGYYEPGHYAFLSVLGTRNQKDLSGKSLGKSHSPGMKLTELSALCAALGMRAAYNLDGGQSAGMYWDGQLFGHNNRSTSDALAVIDAGGSTP